MTAQQTKIDNDLNIFKYYPVVSLAFGYKFRSPGAVRSPAPSEGLQS